LLKSVSKAFSTNALFCSADAMLAPPFDFVPGSRPIAGLKYNTTGHIGIKGGTNPYFQGQIGMDVHVPSPQGNR
jgi:hypothetical protein